MFSNNNNKNINWDKKNLNQFNSTTTNTTIIILIKDSFCFRV